MGGSTDEQQRTLSGITDLVTLSRPPTKPPASVGTGILLDSLLMERSVIFVIFTERHLGLKAAVGDLMWHSGKDIVNTAE